MRILSSDTIPDVSKTRTYYLHFITSSGYRLLLRRNENLMFKLRSQETKTGFETTYVHTWKKEREYYRDIFKFTAEAIENVSIA